MNQQAKDQENTEIEAEVSTSELIELLGMKWEDYFLECIEQGMGLDEAVSKTALKFHKKGLTGKTMLESTAEIRSAWGESK